MTLDVFAARLARTNPDPLAVSTWTSIRSRAGRRSRASAARADGVRIALPAILTFGMRATVKENTEVAKGTRMVVFDLQGAEVDFQPGQYFFVNLIDPPYEDEKGPRRHFSVVTSPNERGVLGFATRIRDTAFKRSVAELEVGAEADVEEPKGGYVLPEDTSRPYAFIAGGIGITVFRCMLPTSPRTGSNTASRSCTRTATASRRRSSRSSRRSTASTTTSASSSR